MSLAIANRYASALADVLSGGKADATPDEALSQLRDFQQVLESAPELRTVFAAPSVSHGDKQKLAAAIGARIGVSTSIRNLLFVLLDNRRMGLLPELIKAVQEWFDDQQGIRRIAVTSSAPLLDDQRRAVVEKFKRLTGREIEATFDVDDSLLGGAVVRVGSKLLQEGVITRPLVPYGLRDWLRISIGTEAENARCLAALGKVLGR